MPAAILKFLKVAWPYMVAFSVGFGSAYYWQGLRWDAEVATLKQDWADERRKLADAANDELQRQISLREEQATIISQLDQEHTRELQNAEKEIERVRDELRTGERRLYVDADCPGSDGVPGDSTASSVDNGAGKARLNADTAERLVRLTERGDRAIRQLTACQDYVKTILNKRGTNNDD